jgi:hypothetical protein
MAKVEAMGSFAALRDNIVVLMAACGIVLGTLAASYAVDRAVAALRVCRVMAMWSAQRR